MRTWSPRWDVPASRKFATPNFVTTNRASHQPAYPRDNADATIRQPGLRDDSTRSTDQRSLDRMAFQLLDFRVSDHRAFIRPRDAILWGWNPWSSPAHRRAAGGAVDFLRGDPLRWLTPNLGGRLLCTASIGKDT